MKNPILIAVLIITTNLQLFAQDYSRKPSIAVLNIDTKGFNLEASQMGDIARIEISKLAQYEVMDKYDVRYLIEKSEMVVDDCYGKICLVEAGKILKVDKMLTGAAEVFQDRIIVTLRVIDVGTSQVEKTKVIEFLNIRDQIQMMIKLTLQHMFELSFEADLMNKLTQPFDYESAVNVTDVDQLSLNGPRMGMTLFTGQNAEIMKQKEAFGGMDVSPLMFQFGYQFEVKYLNQGNFQALFEFIPMVTGLDQGKFIPSFSLLNGLRHNRIGLEFAFGPTMVLTKKAKGYYDENNDWNLESEWDSVEEGENPFPIEKRLDSRGEFDVSTGFVFAVGKTFRSGRLNIPINAFFVPNKDGNRFGISVGYNASKYRR